MGSEEVLSVHHTGLGRWLLEAHHTTPASKGEGADTGEL
jgi:hypothetical protein